MGDLLTASIEPVLLDWCTPTWVRDVLRAGANNRATGRDFWQELDELGFLDALVPESAGGAGISLADCAGVLFSFGRYAMPLPAAHTMLARRLLATASVNYSRGPIAFAFVDASVPDTAFVPYGLACDSMLVERSGGLWLVDAGDVTIHRRAEWGGLDATVVLPSGVGTPVIQGHGSHESTPTALLESGALAASCVMVGAMSRVLEMTITHVNDRQQFGRSIGKFQVVQHNLSVVAEHAAAARIAVQRACASGSSLSVAIAKARASRAAPVVANTAHALTGAMGITAEYDLQLYTRLLHAQRLQFGSETWWDEIVGSHALAHWGSLVPGIVGELQR
jgi:acyl-CoA dehydrogenase